MPRWNVLIVDDEELARSNVAMALRMHPDWQVCGVAANVAQARVAMVQHAPDLVLLDIQMPRESGLALASELAAQPQPPLVVFVTAHDAHALAAFEVHAVDYLLKPLDDQRLAHALQRAAQLLQSTQRNAYARNLQAFARERTACVDGVGPPALTELVIRSVGAMERVPVAAITHLVSAANYVELRLSCGRCVLHRATLGALEQRLPPGAFMRVHRTALVRPAQVASLQIVGDGVYSVRLHDGSTLPVSERYVAAVRALFT